MLTTEQYKEMLFTLEKVVKDLKVHKSVIGCNITNPCTPVGLAEVMKEGYKLVEYDISQLESVILDLGGNTNDR